MTRVGFTLIGGKNWTGGYNYLLNLVQILATHQSGRITVVLFFGADASEEETAPFRTIEGAEVVRSPLLNAARKSRSLLSALVWGCDPPVRALFEQHRLDVVFECAQFFGWRPGIPVIGWITDLQHRFLPDIFSSAAYWKRDLGFRAQIAAGRAIMLSSEDSRQACERFYAAAAGRTHVVHFAVPPGEAMNLDDARAVADQYGLPQQFFFMPNQFWKHKHHLLVAEALALLRAGGISPVIAASGKQADPRDPQYFPSVQARIAELGIEHEFRLLGMIPYPHLGALMHASVGLLNPSRFEGWSTTVEEARSLGVPMLLSDLPVHREQAGPDAVYFDPASAKSLASALRAFQPLPRAERERRIAAARADAQLRVTEFSQRFADLAEHCVTSHVQP